MDHWTRAEDLQRVGDGTDKFKFLAPILDLTLGLRTRFGTYLEFGLRLVN